MDKILYKLDTFEGPLDLLLTLIQKNKVSIYDIPIVEILRRLTELKRLILIIQANFLLWRPIFCI